MKNETLRFSTFGGEQDALCVPASSPRAVVGILPAVGIRADYYGGFLGDLARQGIAGVAADWIGAGASPMRASRRVSWSYRELVHEHAQGLFEAATRRFDGAPFYWLGHSLGGHVALLHAGARDAVQGVALFASGSPHHRAWSGAERLRMSVGAGLVRLISAGLGHFPGARFGFGEREAAGWARDWYKVHRRGTFTHRGFDGDALLRRMTSPILAATVFDDRLAPVESTDLLVARTSSTDITKARWTAARSIGHSRWPRHLREVAADEFTKWIASR